VDRYIVDIMPAANWYAIYRSQDEIESFSPLVGWALYDSNDSRQVAGLVADRADKVVFCDEHPNFVGYRYWAGLPEDLVR
jgi:hypothetical protein